MKTRQGVRDLSKLAVVWVDPATNITHVQHSVWHSQTACGLLNTGMYRPLEEPPVSCLECLCFDPKKPFKGDW